MRIKETNSFKRIKSKLDKSYLERVEKTISKIIQNPEIGKLMKHNRKGTREVYISPFKLYYSYNFNEGVLTFLDFYHKDEQ